MKRRVIALIAVGLLLATLAFQTGRKSVVFDASSPTREGTADSVKSKPARTLSENDFHNVLIQNVAAVSFPELYDLLRAAPREQVLEWAAQLDKMPWSAKRSSALKAFYKALVQADAHLACDAIARARTTSARELATLAITSAAPESAWGVIAKTLCAIEPDQTRRIDDEIIWSWSEVDPEAAAEFVENHRTNSSDSIDYALVANWAGIDFETAREWVEEDPRRQTSGAINGLLWQWYDIDRAGAANYLVAHQDHPAFAEGLQWFAKSLVSEQPAEARAFIMSLSSDVARDTMESIAGGETAVVVGAPRGYKQYPDRVSKWMVTLPGELWRDRIGGVINMWAFDHRAEAYAWMNQLPPDSRDTAITSFCSTSNGNFHGPTSEFQTNLSETLRLAFSISDSKLKDEALRSLTKSSGKSLQPVIDIETLNISRAQKATLRRLAANE